jgi:hypothetical protein
MPAKDYIPSKEGDIVPWTENFISVANANLATLGLVALDITNVTTKKTDYTTKLNSAIAKQAESKAATEAKNISKSGLVDNIRVLARQIQARPGVPSNLKEQLGLNIPEPSPSPSNPFPPTELSAAVVAAGLCNLKWNRNSNPQGTIFLIESSINPDTGWHIIGTTTKTTYETPLPEAVGHNFFRTRAQRGDLVSEVSNVAVV